MQYRPIVLTFLFSAFLSLHALCQEYSYSHYDVKEGLPSSTIYSMAEDRDGFIWFATEGGLSRFDGTHFTNFTTADGLPDNEVLKVFVDSRNRVWLMPFLNYIAYYWKGKIHTVNNDSLLARVKAVWLDNVNDIKEDKAGNILLSCQHTLCMIDTSGHVAVIKKLENKLFTAMTAGLNLAGQFRLIYTQSIRLNKNDHVIADIELNSYKSIDRFHVLDKYATGPGFFLFLPSLNVIDSSGVYLFRNEVSGASFSIPNPRDIISLSALNDNTVTFNTQEGVLLVDPAKKKIVDTFLKGQAVNGVVRDAEGNYWMSTLGQGVFRLGSTEFRNYTSFSNGNAQPVFSIGNMDSTLYVGADHFLLGKFGHDRKHITYKRTSGDNSLATRGRIMAFLYDTLIHSAIIGTDNGVFIEGTPSFQKLTNFYSVKGMVQRDDSSLAVFAGQSLALFGLNDLHFITTSPVATRTTCGAVLGKMIYYGTVDGLHMLDSNNKVFYWGDKDALLKNRTAAMTFTADSILWLATYGSGLVGFKEGKVIAHISQEDGLTSNICRALFADGNTLWVGTNKGLNKVIRSSGKLTIIPYTTGDGLNSDIINTVYVEGKQVYVGTSEGLSSFDESRIAKQSECKLHFTTIHAGEQKWEFDTTNFVVPRQNNNLQFEFVGISFKSGSSITYQYRLRGLSDRWLITKNNILNYPALPSGAYDLEVVATNKFGIHSDTAMVHFVIEKSFQEKTWVRLSVLLLVALLVWAFFTYRVRSLRKKEKEKTETVTKMAELEQMALRSQMNPHFIFNCLNSIQEYVLDRDVLGANDFISKFANLIRQTLDLSSRDLISVEEELIYISTYLGLEKKRFGNKFIYEITVEKTIDQHEGCLPPMILQPYVENAIRHGIGYRQDKKGKILLSMSLVESYLVCIIEDNGVGRKRSGLFKKNAIHYQSKGMSLVEKRVAMFNKVSASPVTINVEDLHDAMNMPAGTRITIRFPYIT